MALLFASVIFFVYLCSRKTANAKAAELSSVKSEYILFKRRLLTLVLTTLETSELSNKY